jgi:L-rhamnonate dehydratase
LAERFRYIFDGEPVPTDGDIDLDENTPGLVLTVNEESLKRFKVVVG